MRGSMGGQGVPTPSQKYSFLSDIGPDPLKNHKAAKSAFNVGPPLVPQIIAVFGSSHELVMLNPTMHDISHAQ